MLGARVSIRFFCFVLLGFFRQRLSYPSLCVWSHPCLNIYSSCPDFDGIACSYSFKRYCFLLTLHNFCHMGCVSTKCANLNVKLPWNLNKCNTSVPFLIKLWNNYAQYALSINNAFFQAYSLHMGSHHLVRLIQWLGHHKTLVFCLGALMFSSTASKICRPRNM